MGRHAGWLAAAAGLAGASRDEAPQIILFPERAFDEAKFLATVKAVGRARRLVRGGGVAKASAAPTARFVADAGAAQGRLRPHPTRRRRAGGRRPGQGQARLQGALDGARLPAALGAPPRLEDRPRAGAGGRQGRGGVRAGRPERGDAGDQAHGPTRRIAGTSSRRRWSKVANHEKKMPAGFIRADGYGITAAVPRATWNR